jgi:hypothetical protein
LQRDLGIAALLAITKFRFFPQEIDAVSFVPFCALVGGMTSAVRHVLLNGFDRFPRQESFRGAFLGTLFGLCFVGFGVLDG